MVIRVALIVFAPTILLLELLMPYFILLLYGEEYAASSFYIRLILPFVFLGLPGLIFSSYFAAKGRFKDLFYINISAVFTSLLCLYLVSFYTLSYAPIASLNMTFITITITSIYILSKENVKIMIVPGKNDLFKLILFIKSISLKIK